jgi:hypothetical protein
MRCNLLFALYRWMRVPVFAARHFVPYHAMPTQTRVLACLVFLILAWSAVDALPDPPAVKSRRALSNAAPLTDNVAVVSETPANSLASRGDAQAFSIRLTQDGEVAQPSCGLFIRHATDASPPRFI